MKYLFAVLAIALSFPGIAEGQLPGVAAGARIRVTAPARSVERQVTTVLEVRGDSIVVGVPGRSYTLGPSEITALEVSTGRRRQAAKGAAIGLVIGAVSGAVLGAATYKECEPQGILDCLMESRGLSTFAVGTMGGAAGLVIGAVAGALITTDRWNSVELPVRFAVAPTPTGGLGVVLTRSF